MTEFIAEIGSNYFHNNKRDLGRAKELIQSAARSGAGTVKFQYFEADKLYNKQLKPDIVAELEKISLPKSWLPELKSTCDSAGVEFLCSIFHPDHVELLDEYVNRWKIASGELFVAPHINPLFPAIAKTGKPVIMSTAGADMETIDWCANALVDRGTDIRDIVLLHCTCGYPSALEETELNKLVDIAENFMPMRVGFSSHITNPIVTAAAVLYFAEIIEVHYDMADLKGNESGHSYTPQQFQELIRIARMLMIAKNGTSKNEETFIGKYRKHPDDWLRPLNREV